MIIYATLTCSNAWRWTSHSHVWRDSWLHVPLWTSFELLWETGSPWYVSKCVPGALGNEDWMLLRNFSSALLYFILLVPQTMPAGAIKISRWCLIITTKKPKWSLINLGTVLLKSCCFIWMANYPHVTKTSKYQPVAFSTGCSKMCQYATHKCNYLAWLGRNFSTKLR